MPEAPQIVFQDPAEPYVVWILKEIIWRELCPMKLQQLAGKKTTLGVSAGKMAISQLFFILSGPSEPLQMDRAKISSSSQGIGPIPYQPAGHQ